MRGAASDMRKRLFGACLIVCAGLIPAAAAAAERPSPLAGWQGVEPRRWPAPIESPAGPCLAALAGAGVDAVAAEAPAAPIVGCAVAEPVRLRAVTTAQGLVRIAGAPLVACKLAARLGAFAREVAAPLAQGGAGSSLVAIEAGGGYECRPRNRVPGAKLSAHGQGLALDAAAVRLADGRRLAVGGAHGESEARFLAGLRAAACGYFHTVLGPGADAAHADHLHLDLEPRGARGDSRLCQ